MISAPAARSAPRVVTEKEAYGFPDLIGISAASSATERPGAELTEIPSASARISLPVSILPPLTTSTLSSGSDAKARPFVGTPPAVFVPRET